MACARALLALSAVLLLAYGADAQATTLAQAVAGRPELTQILEAIKASPTILGVATDNATVATVFLPTNDAIAKFAKQYGQAAVDKYLGNVETLTAILAYHVVPGVVVKKGDVPSKPTKVPTVAGSTITVSRKNGVVTVKAAYSTAKGVRYNIPAGKSIIHTIDTILLPVKISVPKAPPPAKRRSPPARPVIDNIVAAASTRSDLNIVLAAASALGVAPTLADPNSALTVFLPTDAAFTKLFAAMNVTPEALLSNEQGRTLVTGLLLYHVIEGKYPSSVVPAAPEVLTAETLNGAPLNFTKADGVVTVTALFSKATVIAADIDAGKSIVHVIDEVLLPVNLAGGSEQSTTFPSLLAAVAGTPELAALAAAGGVVAANNPVFASVLTSPDTVATVFAPSSAAFGTALQALGITQEQLLASGDTLVGILSYHVVLGVAVKSTDLAPTQQVPTVAGPLLTVVKNTTGVFVIGAKNTAKVIKADIGAGSAVVHVIDAVLLP